MKNKILILFFGLFLLTAKTNAQYLEKGPQGKIIVIYPDGSWRYYQDADSIYSFQPQEPLSKKERKRIEKQRQSQEEAEQRLAEEQAKEAKRNEKKSKKAKTIESSPESDETEQLSRKERKRQQKELQAQVEADLAKYRAEKEAEESNGSSSKEVVTIEGGRKQNQKGADKKNKDDSKNLKKRVKEEKKLIRRENELQASLLEIQSKIVEEKANSVQVITESDIAKAQKQNKKIQKYTDTEADILAELAVIDQERILLDLKYGTLDGITLEQSKRSGGSIQSPEKFNITYSEQVNVINHPPKTDCKLVFDDKKPGTSDLLREVAAEPISSYTPANLKAFYKDDDQIKIYANASSLSGGFRYLNLEIHVNSKSAIKDYGNFRAGQPLNVMDLNKEVYTFPINFLAPPELTPDRQGYIFKASYQMDNQSMKKIEKNLLDRMRIVWTTGFEEYEIYNVDFLERHLDCLNQ